MFRFHVSIPWERSNVLHWIAQQPICQKRVDSSLLFRDPIVLPAICQRRVYSSLLCHPLFAKDEYTRPYCVTRYLPKTSILAAIYLICLFIY